MNHLFTSFRIGKIFGVPTDLHWSFLLVPVAILFYAYHPEAGFAWGEVGYWSAITVLLFSFVLAHELGHALMAQNRGVRAEKIILFPLGGGALIPDEPERMWDEVLVYFAGPLANIVLALIALPLLLLQPGGEYLLRFYLNPFGNLIVSPTLVEQLLGITLAVNLLLALGNLLPAYPLDGGRILRALLKPRIGKRSATVVATLLGILVGGLLLIAAWWLTDPLLAISAVFVISFSAMELNRGWQRRSLARTPVNKVIRPLTAGRLYASDSVETGRSHFAATNSPILPVYSIWNELSGFAERELLTARDAKGEDIEKYYEPEFVTATATDNLLEITERIVDADVYGAAIYDGKGEIAGFVYTEDVIQLLNQSPRRFYRKFTSRV